MTLNAPSAVSGVKVADDGWHSTWQTNDKKHDYAWATETIYLVTQPDGRIMFGSHDNDLEYRWTGEGREYSKSYIAGAWKSEKGNSEGAFILHNTDSQGEIKTGFLLGPDTELRKNYGAWILVKKSAGNHEQLVAEAKKRLALDMCPGLGDLVELSNGQFMRRFLHPEIATTALQLLIADKHLEAVRAVSGSLRDHLRKIIGSASDGGPLIKEAFRVQTGKLSNGRFVHPPGSLKRDREEATQGHMLELFLGSLYIRNLHEHSSPLITTENVLRILMIFSYLLYIIDEQHAKQSTSTL
jgi:hypothetical protein